MDSTSTITGSPASSALHDAGNNWEAESSTTEGKPPVLEVDTHPVSISTDNDSDYCGSAVSLATFYTARSSLGSDSPDPTSPVVDLVTGASA